MIMLKGTIHAGQVVLPQPAASCSRAYWIRYSFA